MKTPNNSQFENIQVDSSSQNQPNTDSCTNIETQKTNALSNLYQVSVAIRASIAAAGAVGGHAILEPLGVPHGAAEQVALTFSTALFAPEMIVAGVRIASSDVLEKVKKLTK